MNETELEKMLMGHPAFAVTIPQILASLKRIESVLDLRHDVALEELIQEKPKYDPENVEKAAQYVGGKISHFHAIMNQHGQTNLSKEEWAQYNLLTDINRLLKGFELRRPGHEEAPAR
jgi:hypothetical protein